MALGVRALIVSLSSCIVLMSLASFTICAIIIHLGTCNGLQPYLFICNIPQGHEGIKGRVEIKFERNKYNKFKHYAEHQRSISVRNGQKGCD